MPPLAVDDSRWRSISNGAPPLAPAALEDAATLMTAAAAAAAAAGQMPTGGASAEEPPQPPRYYLLSYRGRPLATPSPQLIAAHRAALLREPPSARAVTPAIMAACAATVYSVLAIGARLDTALAAADEYASRARAALAVAWDAPSIVS